MRTKKIKQASQQILQTLRINAHNLTNQDKPEIETTNVPEPWPWRLNTTSQTHWLTTKPPPV